MFVDVSGCLLHAIVFAEVGRTNGLEVDSVPVIHDTSQTLQNKAEAATLPGVVFAMS